MMMAAAACIFAAACEKETEDEGKDPNPGDNQQEVEYLLVATPLEGSQFAEFTDTEMRFVLADSVLMMNRTQFAERMPRLDIEVPGVVPDESGVFAADSIIPILHGQPMAQYVMTDFKLAADKADNRLGVEFDCMTMHVVYSGVLDAAGE